MPTPGVPTYPNSNVRPFRPILLRRHDHNRASCPKQDTVCRAADQKIVERRMAVRAHHNVIDRVLRRLIDDMLNGRAAELHRFAGNVLMLY